MTDDKLKYDPKTGKVEIVSKGKGKKRRNGFDFFYN
jgi:hypothetical protein